MRKQIAYPFIFLLTLFSASGCSSDGTKHVVIRVLNAADYIYEAEQEGYYCEECHEYISSKDVKVKTEDEEEIEYHIVIEDEEEVIHEVYYDSDMMKQFVSYMDEKYADEGITFSYVYDTFDTPETCYNELKTGKSNYDVINVSDYMLQKMMSNNLIQPLFEVSEEAEDIKENIASNMSRYLWGEDSSIFNNIYAKKLDYKDDEDPYDYEKCLADYSVPYMWGTIGIMYNSKYYEAEAEELGVDIDEEFSSWDVLYNDFAKNSFSIKDSVRDVYAVSVLHSFKDEISELEKEYHIGEEDEDLTGFNEALTKIFNSCDDETILKVKEDMLKLKDNAFGFEVDSGKTDMVAGDKIGANLAWSGDAAWAIYEAQTESDAEISFQVPKEGSNIWFDAWCIPTVADHPQYALDLIDFMSEPDQAIANMDYVGYTTATAGDMVLDYMLDNYDVRAEEEDYPDEPYEEYDITYFFEDSLEEHDIEDAILHAWLTDSEVTYEEYINDELIEVPYAMQARMLKAQFPRAELLPRLCVMDDYGKNNEKVLDMWQTVRTNPLPIWAVVLFIIEGVIVLGFVTYYLTHKLVRKKLRKIYR